MLATCHYFGCPHIIVKVIVLADLGGNSIVFSTKLECFILKLNRINDMIGTELQAQNAQKKAGMKKNAHKPKLQVRQHPTRPHLGNISRNTSVSE